jgi:hypothetical protein
MTKLETVNWMTFKSTKLIDQIKNKKIKINNIHNYKNNFRNFT